ncbi:hypothetical protein ABTK78_20105, partial [Acinetobacter baumannii]
RIVAGGNLLRGAALPLWQRWYCGKRKEPIPGVILKNRRFLSIFAYGALPLGWRRLYVAPG